MGSDITKKLELLQDLDLLSTKYKNKNIHNFGSNIPQAYDIGSNLQNPQPTYQRLKHMTDLVLYVAQGYSRPVILGQLNSLSQLQNVQNVVLLAYQVLTPIGKDYITKWYLDNEIYLKNLPDSPYQVPQKLLRQKNGNNLAANKRRQPHQPQQKSERQQQQSSNNNSRSSHNAVPDSEKQLVSPSSYFNQSSRYTHMQPDPRILFSNWVIVMGTIRVYSTIQDDIFAPRIDYKNDTIPLFFLVSKDITGYELYEEVYARMQHKFKPDSKYRTKKNLWWMTEVLEQNENITKRRIAPNSIDSIKVEGSQLLYERKNKVAQSDQSFSRKNSSGKNEDELVQKKFIPRKVTKKLVIEPFNFITCIRNKQNGEKEAQNANQLIQKNQQNEDENITSGVGEQDVDDLEINKRFIKNKKTLKSKKVKDQYQRKDQDQDEADDQEKQNKQEQEQDQSTSQQQSNKQKIQKTNNKARQEKKLAKQEQENQDGQDISDDYFESIATKIEKQVDDHKPFFIRVMSLDFRTCGVCKRNCNGCIVKPDFSQNQFDIQNYFSLWIQMSYTNYSQHILETGVFRHSTAVNIQKEKKEREKKNISSLSTCLKRLTDKQVLEGKDAAYCSSCKEHQKHEKTLSVFRLPPILVFQFKRFRFQNQFRNSKISTIINFPLHGLNMNEFLDPDQEKVYQNYDLYAVLNHYGSLNSGHYTACIMDEKGEWTYYDDSDIHPMPNSQEVRSQYAYMLFYKQRGIQDKKIEQIFPSLLQKFTGKPIKYKDKYGYICDKGINNKFNIDYQNYKSFENKALIQSLQNESVLQQNQKSFNTPLSLNNIGTTELKIGNTLVIDQNKDESMNQKDVYVKMCEKGDYEQVFKIDYDQLDKQVDEDYIDNSEIQIGKRSSKKEQDANLKKFLQEKEEDLQRDKQQQPKISFKNEGISCFLFQCNCSKKNKGDSKNSFNNSSSLRNEEDSFS